MSFYLTLPSNSSMSFFPNNKIGDYTTKLFNPINLDGEWEVALSEITYPLAWHIRPPGRFTIVDANKKMYTAYLTFLQSDNHSTIAEKLSNYFVKDLPSVKFSITTSRKSKPQFTMSYTEGSLHSIRLDPHVKDILGYQSTTINLENSKETVTSRDFNLEALNAFYIYSDVIKHQYVGDVMAKVLRVVALDNDYETTAKYINKTFDAPHYVPLERNNLDNINISFKNSLGENITFESGKITVKLHLRQKFY